MNEGTIEKGEARSLPCIHSVFNHYCIREYLGAHKRVAVLSEPYEVLRDRQWFGAHEWDIGYSGTLPLHDEITHLHPKVEMSGFFCTICSGCRRE